MKRNVFSRKEVGIQLILFLIVGVAIYFLSSYLDFFETVYEFVKKNEKYELDELFVIFFFWTILLLIFVIIKSRSLIKRNIVVDQLSNDLKEQISSRDKLQSILAHDLKAPFNPIIGLSDLLLKKNGQLDNKTKLEYIEMINNASRATFHLLENILDWSLLKSGKFTPTFEKLALKDLVGNSITLMKAYADKKQIEFISDVPEDVFIWADENMIKTVLRNLLSNAIKFSNTGSNVKIVSSNRHDHIEITISDNGIGVPREKIEKLKAGEIESSKGTSNESGTGLGLMVCKEFVNLNNGEIDIKSIEGIGSDFSFTIPKI